METSKEPIAPQHDTKISLVITTLGRREELSRCLESIANQSQPPHEVIVVDQNPPGWLASTLAPFAAPRLPLITISSERGAARGRNRGCTIATGSVLGFPDDDCWYSPKMLQLISSEFLDKEIAGLCFPIFDETDTPLLPKCPTKDGLVSRGNIWTTCLMAGFFLRATPFHAIKGFNEELGIGAASGLESGEETDLALRLLSTSSRIGYVYSKGIFHPPRPPIAQLAIRARCYGRGLGYVFAKYRLGNGTFIYYLSRALLAGGVELLRNNLGGARFYWQSFLGRCEGWKMGRRDASNL